jgi:hypothetical protein
VGIVALLPDVALHERFDRVDIALIERLLSKLRRDHIAPRKTRMAPDSPHYSAH